MPAFNRVVLFVLFVTVFVFLSRRANHVHDYYDSREVIDEIKEFRDGRWHFEIGEKESHLYSLGDIKVGHEVLDFGSGLGTTALDLAKRGCDVIAVNFSRKQISESPSHPSIKYVLTDGGVGLRAIKSNSLDRIVFQESVCHVSDKAGLFRAFYRCLKPGGILVGQDWVADSSTPLARKINEQYHCCMETAERYVKCMERAGFSASCNDKSYEAFRAWPTNWASKSVLEHVSLRASPSILWDAYRAGNFGISVFRCMKPVINKGSRVLVTRDSRQRRKEVHRHGGVLVVVNVRDTRGYIPVADEAVDLVIVGRDDEDKGLEQQLDRIMREGGKYTKAGVMFPRPTRKSHAFFAVDGIASSELLYQVKRETQKLKLPQTWLPGFDQPHSPCEYLAYLLHKRYYQDCNFCQMWSPKTSVHGNKFHYDTKDNGTYSKYITTFYFDKGRPIVAFNQDLTKAFVGTPIPGRSVSIPGDALHGVPYGTHNRLVLVMSWMACRHGEVKSEHVKVRGGSKSEFELTDCSCWKAPRFPAATFRETTSTPSYARVVAKDLTFDMTPRSNPSIPPPTEVISLTGGSCRHGLCAFEVTASVYAKVRQVADYYLRVRAATTKRMSKNESAEDSERIFL